MPASKLTIPLPGLHEVKAMIPDRLFERDSARASGYLLRDLAMAITLGYLVLTGQSFLDSCKLQVASTLSADVLSWSIWIIYWWFQGLIFTGIWVIGHECGHGTFSSSRTFSDIVGFICHSALWTPYFSWKFTHQSHHRNHGSMERDEHWIPRTRTEFMNDLSSSGTESALGEYFSDTPIVTVLYLLIQQLFGFPAYLLMNTSGQPKFPRGTSHFNPLSNSLFRRSQRKYVILSDIGIFLTGAAVYTCINRFGKLNVLNLYGIPCLAVGHWVTMIVFLQHTDPHLPHYRQGAWSYTRGALATMDRDFLGWQGRFFLHNIAHYHVVHHLFPKIPFYNTEEATLIVKRAFSPEYWSSSKPVFQTLWENFNNCQFVDNEGDIIHYRHKKSKIPACSPKPQPDTLGLRQGGRPNISAPKAFLTTKNGTANI